MYCKLFHYGTYVRLNAHSGVTVGHRVYLHKASVLKITHIIRSRSLAYLNGALCICIIIVIVIIVIIFSDIAIIIIIIIILVVVVVVVEVINYFSYSSTSVKL